MFCDLNKEYSVLLVDLRAEKIVIPVGSSYFETQ